MNKKSVPPKTSTTSFGKGGTNITIRAPKSVKFKLTATKGEVKAAGDKVMKKYSVAIKKLADR